MLRAKIGRTVKDTNGKILGFEMQCIECGKIVAVESMDYVDYLIVNDLQCLCDDCEPMLDIVPSVLNCLPGQVIVFEDNLVSILAGGCSNTPQVFSTCSCCGATIERVLCSICENGGE